MCTEIFGTQSVTIKYYLVVCALIAAAAALEPSVANYHEAIGIPRAEEIRRAEEVGELNGGRIINGQPAPLGQFPYMGGLLISLDSGHTSVCGSSLISNTKLVTAAHCSASTARMYTVVLGSVTLYSGGVRIPTRNVVVHPQYDQLTINNDVAVITIPWTAFNNIIQPINLASGSNNFNNQWVTASGFGLTSITSGVSPVLNFVSLRVISNAECMARYGPIFVIDSTLCTDGNTHNTCSSDSGGPLALGNQLVGIVSFGGSSCGLGLPGAHARVSSFASWIQSQM